MSNIGEVAQEIVDKNKSPFVNDDWLYRSIKIELERSYIEGKSEGYKEAERDFVSFCKSNNIEITK